MTHTKFQFDVCFDEVATPATEAIAAIIEQSWEEEEPQEELPPPPQMFSEEELELSKKLSYADGYEAGLAEATQRVEQQQLTISQKISVQLAALQEHNAAQWQVFEQETVAVGMAIAKTVFPHWANAAKQMEIAAMLQELLPALHAETRLVVQTAAVDAEWIEEMIQKALTLNGNTATLRVEALETLQTGDMIVQGEHSSAERLHAAMWEKITGLQGKKQEKTIHTTGETP